MRRRDQGGGVVLWRAFLGGDGLLVSGAIQGMSCSCTARLFAGEYIKETFFFFLFGIMGAHSANMDFREKSEEASNTCLSGRAEVAKLGMLCGCFGAIGLI